MNIVSIIIPFYQREQGILQRALRSITAQRIPQDWTVNIIVIDDGSPVNPGDEASSVNFPPPFHLDIIRQNNGGVAIARNRGLDDMSPDTTLIAFLDSDDIWPEAHLAKAIEAWQLGYDFSFSDNVRKPHHASYCAQCAPKTQSWIEKGASSNGLIDMPLAEMPGLIIEEFPTQASAVVFQKELCRDLRFNAELKAAGEDMLFFVALSAKARKICYNSKTKVECGGGINMFFGNFDWDSPAYLKIKQDRVLCHTMIDRLPTLPATARTLNKKLLRRLRCDFMFHSIRQFLKQRRIPAPTHSMAKSDRKFWAWSLASVIRIIVGYPLGTYRP